MSSPINASGTGGGQAVPSYGSEANQWLNFATGLVGQEGTQTQKGTQKQTGTVTDTGTTEQISPEALALIAQVFPQLLAQTTGGDYSKAAAIKDSQGIVNQVMQTLKEQVLPQIYSGEAARGGYSSTAKALLTNDAASRAAAQAASLVGDIATKYGGVQATQQNSLINLINAAVGASKRATTDTTKTTDLTQTTDMTSGAEKEGLLNRLFGW